MIIEVPHPLETGTIFHESHGSATYQVIDTSVSEYRILKVLMPRAHPSKEVFPCVSDASMYLLLHSPAIAHYHRIFPHHQTGAIYITRELFKEPLGCLIQSYRDSCLNMSEYTILKITKQILEGLCYLHESKLRSSVSISPSSEDGIIHGRLHLNNVMLRQDGTVALCDMSYLFPNSIPYTPCNYNYLQSLDSFIAPEAAEQGFWSTKSDMWSLGILMLIMCTLEAPEDPYSTGFQESLSENPFLSRYSTQLKEIILALLSFAPNERPGARFLLKLPIFASIKDMKLSFNTKETIIADNQISTSNLTPLMQAASVGDCDTARAHLNQCGLTTLLGKTALMYAAQNGHAALVPLLRDEATLQIVSQASPAYGRTALMYASIHNHPDVVTQLLPLEARMQNGKGKTALMMAAEKGHTRIVKMLAPHEKGMRTNIGVSALMLALLHKKWDALKILVPLEKGIRTKQGRTALMMAANHDIPEAIEYILASEGQLVRKNGMTALMLAASRGSAAFVKRITELFASDPSSPYVELGMRDKHGRTALIHAARNAQVTCMALLLNLEKEIVDDKQHNVAYHVRHMVKKARGSKARSACLSLLAEHGLIESKYVDSILDKEDSPLKHTSDNSESISSPSLYAEELEESPQRLSTILPSNELQDVAIYEAVSQQDTLMSPLHISINNSE